MKFKRIRWISATVCICLMMVTLGNLMRRVPAQDMVAHSVAAGNSWEGNPLKGFVPFEEKTSAFPHSMEWFYIPVSAVQTGMNSFDWTALENRLNTIAGRGHQAVLRFYYDYPGEASGVPQFLIDQGLEMRYYNEPERLGGSGYCPDYENALFRQSMVQFIHAFGEKYDGDKRIGFITLGLLGFWGEWHNWPFDDGSEPGKDWSIPTAVYKEVLDAFDSSFGKTELCVREPKSGINFNNYDVGFHDDSFGYATLSQASGGQDWSFMQKMYNFGMGERWKTNCIGGEVYPPSQNDIFSGRTPDGSFQSWELCMQEAHATWMLCEQMKYYQGTTKTNARNAAKQLGYDFQVTTAYYPNQCSDTIPVKIAIKNIGSAPFYYDHENWPVAIGVKQNGSVVKQWKTDWDLCDIPADATLREFSYTIENAGLEQGNYTLCMKVINPLENGNILGFANEGQQSDGWLTLGNVNIAQGTVETTTKEEATTEEETTTREGTTVSFYEEETAVKIQVSTNLAYQTLQAYLDVDGKNDSGFVNGSDGLDTSAGFDFLLEGNSLYRYSGTGSNWSWTAVENAEVSVNSRGEIVIPKSVLTTLNADAKVQVRLVDSSWNGIYVSQLISMFPYKAEGLEVNGFQINARKGGLRTIYSASSTIHGEKIRELGLIYGLDVDGFQREDMILENQNPYVHVEPCDAVKGPFSQTLSMDQSYAMTMKFAVGNAKEFTTGFFVRAYAMLENGEVVYTDIHQYQIGDIAEEAYHNQNLSDAEKNYIYNRILSVIK